MITEKILQKLQQMEIVDVVFFDVFNDILIEIKKTTLDFLPILTSDNFFDDLISFLKSENIDCEKLLNLKSFKMRIKPFKTIYDIINTNYPKEKNNSSETILEGIEEEIIEGGEDKKILIEYFQNFENRISGNKEIIFYSLIYMNREKLKDFSIETKKYEKITLEEMTENKIPNHLKIELIKSDRLNVITKILIEEILKK